MELIALLSTGKGTWSQVSGLIKFGEWDNVIVLGSDFAKDFKHDRKFEFIKVDLDKKLKDLKEDFSQKLKGKIDGTEVALRSEEHTSELQSHSFISYAVFCLKKKK